jgi:hypothetical protein
MSLEVELLELAVSGDEDELEARVSELTKSQYIRVMKSLQVLDNALCNHGERNWPNAEYWGRGCPFPVEAEAKAA